MLHPKIQRKYKIPCVPALSGFLQEVPPQNEYLPSARCWTWLCFCRGQMNRDPYIQCPQCNITCCLGRQHNRAMHKRTSDSPLSDGGIQALPVTSLNGVVVADVLLLVLLNSRGWDTGQFFSRKQLSGHFTNTCQLLRGGFHDRGSGNLWQNTPDIQNDTKSIYYTYM